MYIFSKRQTSAFTLLPEVSYCGLGSTHQILVEDKRESQQCKISSGLEYQKEKRESESASYSKSFSLCKQDEKNSFLLLSDAMSCLECMMLNFSVKHNLQVFELDL